MGIKYEKTTDNDLRITDDTPTETVITLSDLKNKKKILQDNLDNIAINYNTNKERLEGELAKVNKLIIEANKLGITEIE